MDQALDISELLSWGEALTLGLLYAGSYSSNVCLEPLSIVLNFLPVFYMHSKSVFVSEKSFSSGTLE